MMQTLVLGTANFGEQYGISTESALTSKQVDEILTWSSLRIAELDTSLDYKGSHTAISAYSKEFSITTKINLGVLKKPSETPLTVTRIRRELCKDKVERILLRPHPKDRLFTLKAIEELDKLKSNGIIMDLGLSIYETDELDYFINNVRPPMTFQVPLNLFNRSFQEVIDSNQERYRDFNYYVRSIFLQGLLLLNPEEVPSKLKEAVEPLVLLKKELSKVGLSPLEATIMFIKSQQWVDGVVIGIRSLDELKRNFELFYEGNVCDMSFLKTLPNTPSRISDPRKW